MVDKQRVPKLSLENVTYIYGKGTPYEICALDNVSIDICGDTVTGIIGHTGSGKSTFVQLLNGLIKPMQGRVLLDGEDIWAKPKEIAKIRFRVGLVMQYPEYQLFEETVAKDIAYGPKNSGLSDSEIADRVKEAAGFAGINEELMKKSPFELSGGQKRRVAIAGIMAMKPDVLVLDEPAAGLDPVGKKSILGGIVDYQRKNHGTVIIVSHSMEDMAVYCDDVIVMASSKVIMHGTADEIFSHEDEIVRAGLDVPEVTRLMRKMRADGYDMPYGIYNVEQAIAAIDKFIRNDVRGRTSSR